ncbi:type VII secretion system-associated protein [Streptomyces griseoaurantiacus]|uniref:type VII secretion system-associated protein n=1 Tax=Streptomyces griseoaurantiacus TaxID=68213 RepID=UPI00369BD4D5
MTSPAGAPGEEPGTAPVIPTASGPGPAPVPPGPAPDPTPEATPAPAPGAEPTAQGGPTAVLRGEKGFREPPEDFVTAARLAPDHWLSVVDRHWDGADGDVPPDWAVLGRWRSDPRGEIVEWEENPEYRPSPEAYGWGEPTGPADEAARIVATGYDHEELLALVLADTEVAVCVDGSGAPAVTEAPDGTSAVPVFSPSPRLEADALPPHEVMPVTDLLDRLPDGSEVLFLSSSAPVAQLVTGEALRAAVADLGRAAAREEAPDPSATTPRPTAGPEDLRRLERSSAAAAGAAPGAG